MNSLALSPKDLKQLDRANSTRSALVRLETWTVAMAAMLVCGVHSADGVTEIPKRARLLGNAARHASGIQLHRARQVMQEWIDDNEDRLEGNVSGSTRVVPMEFLLWCEDAFRGAVHEPQMLNEFLAYIRPSFEADVQRPAQHELVSRLVELEGVIPRVGKVSEPTHTFRGHLDHVLTIAFGNATAPKDRKRVFWALCDLAQRTNPPDPLVGYDSTERKVIYRDASGREKRLGVSDLRYRKEFR